MTASTLLLIPSVLFGIVLSSFLEIPLKIHTSRSQIKRYTLSTFLRVRSLSVRSATERVTASAFSVAEKYFGASLSPGSRFSRPCVPVAFHASCLSESLVELELAKHFTFGLGSDVLVVQ